MFTLIFAVGSLADLIGVFAPKISELDLIRNLAVSRIHKRRSRAEADLLRSLAISRIQKRPVSSQYVRPERDFPDFDALRTRFSTRLR